MHEVFFWNEFHKVPCQALIRFRAQVHNGALFTSHSQVSFGRELVFFLFLHSWRFYLLSSLAWIATHSPVTSSAVLFESLQWSLFTFLLRFIMCNFSSLSINFRSSENAVSSLAHSVWTVLTLSCSFENYSFNAKRSLSASLNFRFSSTMLPHLY